MSAQPFNPSTPEEAFVPDPRLRDCEVPVDALLCLSNRMRALVRLLESSGDDGRDGFTLPHGTILNALWLLDAQIEQLRQLVMAGHGRPGGQP